MTQPDTGRQVADDGTEGPVVRDKRRIDPTTGEVRNPVSSSPDETVVPPADSAPPADSVPPADSAPATHPAPAQDADAVADPAPVENDGAAAAAPVESDLAAERLLDLQRLQAEYVNYRRRVERDRTVARDTAVSGVLESLLPVLDDLHLARQHGDLEGTPFAAVADKLEATLSRHGLERFGEVGEPFDPMVHEALMHTQAELAEGTDVTTVVQVLQPGYRAGERVLRAARVAVADPQ